MSEPIEQRLSIPWMILPPEDGSIPFKLLVSTPAGSVLEFDMPPKTVAHLDQFLGSDVLWRNFFTSLIDSMKFLPDDK